MTLTASQRAGEVLLAAQGLRQRFGGIVALDDVSFTVPEGSICGLIGPNGAGKTTLFNCITRIYPGEGRLLFAGVDLMPLAVHRIAGMGIARTFQNLAMFASMTVEDNIRVGGHAVTRAGFMQTALALPSVAREERQLIRRVDEVVEFLGLAAVRRHRAVELPFGVQKRIELARALVTRPRLILLDEPACGLNHAEVDDLAGVIRAIRADMGATVLLVEHHMRLVMGICDKVVALNFGAKIAEGGVEEVRNHPDVIRAYLGDAA